VLYPLRKFGKWPKLNCHPLTLCALRLIFSVIHYEGQKKTSQCGRLLDVKDRILCRTQKWKLSLLKFLQHNVICRYLQKIPFLGFLGENTRKKQQKPHFSILK
jgi:hypothetical protein